MHRPWLLYTPGSWGICVPWYSVSIALWCSWPETGGLVRVWREACGLVRVWREMNGTWVSWTSNGRHTVYAYSDAARTCQTYQARIGHGTKPDDDRLEVACEPNLPRDLGISTVRLCWERRVWRVVGIHCRDPVGAAAALWSVGWDGVVGSGHFFPTAKYLVCARLGVCVSANVVVLYTRNSGRRWTGTRRTFKQFLWYHVNVWIVIFVVCWCCMFSV